MEVQARYQELCGAASGRRVLSMGDGVVDYLLRVRQTQVAWTL